MDITKEIKRLQDNLHVIRKVAGWTTEEFGERIGVTKQTISNLENTRTVMTKTQYIAIRTVIDYEIVSNKENVALAQVVKVLLDPDNEEDTEDNATKGETQQPNTNRVNNKKKSNAIITDTAIVAGTAAMGVLAANPWVVTSAMKWMSKIIGGKETKR